MERHLPTLTALVLALVLALSSVSMAVARGGMSLSGAMILCLDGSQVSVPLGPDGQPTETMPACPDCTVVQLALHESDPIAAPSLVARAAPSRPHIAPHPQRLLQGGQGRGPPFLI